MVFDDVSLPAAIFVCVTIVMALVGNSLVLLVFGCRWRSTNDTKIYIMVLAALDLLCALMSMPRDQISLLSESACLVKSSSMQIYCKVSVFFTYQLNVASALILVSIAVSRFVKVTKVTRGEFGGAKRFRASRGCNFIKVMVRRGAIAVSTVRGAKVVSLVAICVACLQGSPVLMIYGSGNKAESAPDNLSEAVTSTVRDSERSDVERGRLLYNTSDTATVSTLTYSGQSTTCHTSCLHDIHADYAVVKDVFIIYQCVFFVVMTITLVGIYGAILQQLCCNTQEGYLPSSTRRDSSLFFPDPCKSKMLLQRHQLNNVGRSCSSESEEQAVAGGMMTMTEGGCTQPTSPRSVSGHLTDTTPAMGRARIKSDSVQFGKKESVDELTFFPPLSYSSDHWSAVSLSRQTSQTNDLTTTSTTSTTSPNNRLSTASFQLSKTGNRARLTTLVFLMVTVIYVVSYLPYFIVILSTHLAASEREEEDGEHKETWEECGTTIQAVTKIAMRSYLIANAANPLVYGLCNPYFREQLGKLVTCRRQII